jgi:hypothetical protein
LGIDGLKRPGPPLFICPLFQPRINLKLAIQVEVLVGASHSSSLQGAPAKNTPRRLLFSPNRAHTRRPDVAIVGLREKSECERHGIIPGSLHAPDPDLQENISSGGNPNLHRYFRAI